MKKINIRESLLNMDRETDCKYDLTSLYESCKLDDEKKKQLCQYIDKVDIDATNRFLSNEASSQGLMENASDDISDEQLKEWVDDEYQESTYEYIASKSVPDADGFYTDYTWYRDVDTDEHVFVFGDTDIYKPEDGYFDHQCDSQEEAQEWFDSYNGFDEMDESLNENLEEDLNRGDVINIYWNPDGFAFDLIYLGVNEDGNYRLKSPIYGWEYLVDAPGNKIITPDGKEHEVNNHTGWLDRFIQGEINEAVSVGPTEVPYRDYDDVIAHIDDWNIADYKDELNEYLKSKGVYYTAEVTKKDGKNALLIDIENGDWKHEHIYIDQLVFDFFMYDKGIIVHIDKNHYDKSEDDTYSAEHIYTIRDLIVFEDDDEEPLDESLLTESIRSLNMDGELQFIQSNVVPGIESYKAKYVSGELEGNTFVFVISDLKGCEYLKSKGFDPEDFPTDTLEINGEDKNYFIFMPQELGESLNEAWTDAYEHFNAIVDKHFPDENKIESEVENLYSQHKGEPDWDEAYRRWHEDVDAGWLEEDVNEDEITTVTFTFDPSQWNGNPNNLEDYFEYSPEQLTFNPSTVDGPTQIELTGSLRYINDFKSKYSNLFESITEEEDLTDWFNGSHYDIIDAGWTEDGEIIVSLNHKVHGLENVAKHLTSFIENNNYHVIDWNVNGNNVFVFEVIHNDDYNNLANESLSKQTLDEGWFSDDDFEDDMEHANVYGGDTMYCQDCGTKKQYDEDGYAYCPQCNGLDEDLEDDLYKKYHVSNPHTEPGIQRNVEKLLASEFVKDVQEVTMYDQQLLKLIASNGKVFYLVPTTLSQVDVYDEAENLVKQYVFWSHLVDEVLNDNQAGFVYQVVGGEFAGTYTREEVEELPCFSGDYTEEGSRPKLNNQPVLDGYLSPMVDGWKDNKVVIRYETQEVYDMMSEATDLSSKKGTFAEEELRSTFDESLTEAKTGIPYKGYTICYGCHGTDRWYIKDSWGEFLGTKSGYSTEEEATEYIDDELDECFISESVTEAVAPDGYEPKKKGTAYKVFKVKSGKLYPPMVANPGGADTPVGVWLTADEGEFAGLSKTGRPQVKSTGSGTLSYRPGWHLGDIPRASQFDRTNKETGEKEFPKDFVWAECEYTMDIDYQPESDEQGYMRMGKDGKPYRSDKYQHSLAGLPKLPKDGYYKYRTNPRPDTVPWVITGAIKVNRLLSDAEVNDILASKGIEPIHRQGGDKTLAELGL